MFNDLDGDGVLDVGEVGLAGRTVYLDQSRNYRRDPGERFLLTDANGDYAFDGLSQGKYVVREAPQLGSLLTSPATARMKSSFRRTRSGRSELRKYHDYCEQCKANLHKHSSS